MCPHNSIRVRAACNMGSKHPAIRYQARGFIVRSMSTASPHPEPRTPVVAEAHAASVEAAFWSFAVEGYGRPGVKSRCLELQDRYAIDVLVLLFLCWRASCADALDGPRIRALLERSAPLARQLIGPLRAARRTLQCAAQANASADLAQAAVRLQAAELRAEYLQACWLAKTGLLPADRCQPFDAVMLAGTRIADYLRLAGVESTMARSHADSLAAAVFGS